MKQIYDINSLPFWTEREIRERAAIADALASELQAAFRERNRAWAFERIESPMLIPRALLSPEYDEERIFAIPERPSERRSAFALALSLLPAAAALAELSRLDPALESPPDFLAPAIAYADDPEDAPWPAALDRALLAWSAERPAPEARLALRPETTPATYAWMAEELRASRKSLPYCCWQLNKSFRRERDQPARHVRLKEFWQQEFQFAYASDTADDYQAFCLEPARALFAELSRCPVRIIVSDRLPDYSVRTFDIEAWESRKWMELCSISKRVDFPDAVRLPPKPNAPAREILVLEIATSPDRILHCREHWREAWETLPRESAADRIDPSDFVPNAQAALAKSARRA